VFLYNLLDLKRTTWEGPELDAGKHTIRLRIQVGGAGLGQRRKRHTLRGRQGSGQNSMKNTTPVTFPEDETFDIGRDTRTGVALVVSTGTMCRSSSPQDQHS